MTQINITIPDETIEKIIAESFNSYLANYDIKDIIENQINFQNAQPIYAERIVIYSMTEYIQYGMVPDFEHKTLQDKYVKTLTNIGVKTVEGKENEGKYYIEILFDEPFKVVELIKNINPEQIHSNNPGKPLPISVKKSASGLRTVYFDFIFERPYKSEETVLKNMDALSEFIEKYKERITTKVFKKNISEIYEPKRELTVKTIITD